MSAEVLRDAAKAIREEWGPTRASAWSTVQNFHLAVAAWLQREADLHDALEGVGGLLQTAARELGKGELRIQFSKDADQMAASTMPQALAVAHAYLDTHPEEGTT